MLSVDGNQMIGKLFRSVRNETSAKINKAKDYFSDLGKMLSDPTNGINPIGKP